MRWLVLLMIVGLPLAIAQSLIEAWSDIPVPAAWAVVAWAAVEGRPQRTPWRALAMGVLLDAVDPAPGCWMTLGCLAGAGLVVALKRWFFPGWSAVLMATVIGALPAQFIASALGGWQWPDLSGVGLGLGLAVIIVLCLRWLCAVLPETLHPLPQRGESAHPN